MALVVRGTKNTRMKCGHHLHWLNIRSEGAVCRGCEMNVPLVGVTTTEPWWQTASEADKAKVRNPVAP